MRNKRIIAGLAAFVILVLSLTSPKQKKNEETDLKNLMGGDFLLPFFNNSISELVISPGNTEERIAVVELNGVIQGNQSVSPWDQGYNHEFFLESLDRIADDQSVKGVLFIVNSPGGGVYESAEIRDKILGIKESEIPIYVSMKNMAASGGYYVSADADKIYAYEETVTGSIGVITSLMNFSGLMEKYGVKNYNYTSGDMKAMGSPYQEPSEEEQAIWQAFIDESYDRFVKIIANGRKMDEARVREIADGRIYTANQALELGLLDQIADTQEVLEDLIEATELDDPQIFQYQGSNEMDFFYKFLGLNTFMPKNELTELRTIMDKYGNTFPAPMYLYGGR